MSQFADVFEDFIERMQFSPADVARKSGIHESAIHFLRTGKRDMTFDTVRTLCQKFPDYAGVFLQARLLDECQGPGGDRVAVILVDSPESKVQSPKLSDQAQPYRGTVLGWPLPPGLDDYFRRIAAAWPSDGLLRSMIKWIAERLPAVRGAQPPASSSDSGSGSKEDTRDRESRDTARLNKYTAETVGPRKERKGVRR